MLWSETLPSRLFVLWRAKIDEVHETHRTTSTRSAVILQQYWCAESIQHIVSGVFGSTRITPKH